MMTFVDLYVNLAIDSLSNVEKALSVNAIYFLWDVPSVLKCWVDRRITMYIMLHTDLPIVFPPVIICINFMTILTWIAWCYFWNLKIAVGGKDNVLEGLTDRIHMLHDAIVSDAAQPKTEDIEHAFENFFSSRVIRRMIIDCPAFAVILWRKALEGKCKIWAEGHRYNVLLLNVMPYCHVLVLPKLMQCRSSLFV